MYLTSVQSERLTILRRNLNVSGLSLGPKTGSGGWWLSFIPSLPPREYKFDGDLFYILFLCFVIVLSFDGIISVFDKIEDVAILGC